MSGVKRVRVTYEGPALPGWGALNNCLLPSAVVTDGVGGWVVEVLPEDEDALRVEVVALRAEVTSLKQHFKRLDMWQARSASSSAAPVFKDGDVVRWRSAGSIGVRFAGGWVVHAADGRKLENGYVDDERVADALSHDWAQRMEPSRPGGEEE